MRKTGVFILVFLLLVLMASCEKGERGPAKATTQGVQTTSAEATAPDQEFHGAEASQAGDTAEGEPRIAFDQKDFDFGEVEAGQEVEKTFKFRNTGDGTLLIRNVRSG